MSRMQFVPPGVELQPLRWPAEAIEGESLLGLVTRRGAEHFLGSNRIILKACGIDVRHQGNAVTQATRRNVRELARILLIEKGTIQAMVCTPAGADASGDLVSWGGRTTRLRHLETRSRRISPTSLERSGYHRQTWLLRLLPYCPETFEELIDSCPACGRLLRWSLARPIAWCDESTCDHGDSPIPSCERFLPEPFREAYSRFCDLMSADRTKADAARKKLHPELRDADNPTLVDLIFLMANIDRPCGAKAENSNLRRKAAVELAARLVAGMEAVAEWPQGLERLAARAINKRRSEPHLWTRLKSISKQHPNPAIKVLAVSGVPVLSQSMKRAIAPGSTPVMLQTELVERSGISAEQGAFLSKGDFLRPDNKIGDKGSTKLDRAKCDDFIRQRENSTRNGVIACRLQLPTYGVIQLGISGLLTQPTNRGLNALEPEGRTMTASLQTLMKRLAELEPLPTGKEEMLSVAAASKILGGGLKPWAAIIDAILSRRLPCFRADKSNRLTVRTLMVFQKNLGILETLKGEAVHEEKMPKFISKEDTKEILNTTHRQVDVLESSGVLSFEQQHRKLACQLDRVLHVACEQIFGVELCLATGVTLGGLKSLTTAHGLKSLPTGGWSRDDKARIIASTGTRHTSGMDICQRMPLPNTRGLAPE